VISTWSSGTGGAGVIGAVSYAGLTLVLSIENTLLVMLVVPFLQAVTFWVILKHPTHIRIPITKNGIDSQEQIIKIPEKSFRDKINLVPGLLKYMIPLGLVYLFEYFINQGLVMIIRYNLHIFSLSLSIYIYIYIYIYVYIYIYIYMYISLLCLSINYIPTIFFFLLHYIILPRLFMLLLNQLNFHFYF